MKNVERLFIRQEVTQREEEGCDVGNIRDQVEKAVQTNDSKALNDLYDHLDALEPAKSFAYEEPSTLAEIRQLRPDGPRRVPVSISEEDLHNRIYGGWLGRAALAVWVRRSGPRPISFLCRCSKRRPARRSALVNGCLGVCPLWACYCRWHGGGSPERCPVN